MDFEHYIIILIKSKWKALSQVFIFFFGWQTHTQVIVHIYTETLNYYKIMFIGHTPFIITLCFLINKTKKKIYTDLYRFILLGKRNIKFEKKNSHIWLITVPNK
jgi:hypothetical protein